MGAKITGIGLPPKSNPNLFSLLDISSISDSIFLDIREAAPLCQIIKKADPEIVFHMAAQALVRPGYRDPLETFSTNIMGTANVLDALRNLKSVKVVVAVTTDKVYKNLEHIYPYRETDAIGGYDPYSASKAASELIIASYRDSYLAMKDISVASARAGNVIGGGDWSEDRLIPDAVRAWSTNLALEIRRPKAFRPWQHVLEPLNGYLVLAEKIYIDSSLADAYNFGPKTDEAATVQTVIELAKHAYGCGDILWGDGMDGLHEASLLSLEVSKAREILGITPRWNLKETIKRTMHWYQQQKEGASAHLLCENDILTFTNT